MLGLAFHCPQHIQAAFDEHLHNQEQLYLIGKSVQFVGASLEPGGTSLWVKVIAQTPRAAKLRGNSFKCVGPNIVLSGAAHHWVPLLIPGLAVPQWSIAC
jgi:hypothetical protein